MADEPGPSDSLNFQVWYHGMVTRIQAEATVKLEGEFLIRDSISNPGEYVLTCRWKRKALHFQVNCTVDKGRKTFHFEEEQFTAVVDLLLFYLNHKKPITAASGCLLSVGAQKTSTSTSSNSKDLEAAYMHVFRPGEQRPGPMGLSRQVLVNQATLRQMGPRTLRPVSAYTPEREVVPPLPAALVGRPLPLPIKSPRQNEEQEDYCDIDYDAMENILDASLSAKHRTGSMQSIPNSSLSRQFQSCVNLRMASPAPPLPTLPNPPSTRPALPPRPANFPKKPFLKAGTIPPQKLRTPEEEARDSAFVDYDEPKPKNPDYDILPKTQDYDSLPKTNSDYDSLRKPDLDLLPNPDYDVLSKRLSDGSSDSDVSGRILSRRDSGIYSSPSPPNESTSIFCATQINQLKFFLLNKKPGDIAEAISYEDAKMLHFLGLSEKSGIGADNGLRIVLLPHGAGLRRDLLERCRRVQWTVVISVASVSKKDGPRMVRQWIMAASHLLSKHGNVLGFANIMAALENKMLLSQSHLLTKLDLLALSELKSLGETFTQLKAVNDSHISGVVIPFLQPVLEIFASTQTQYLDESSFANEIDSLWRWLDMARKWSTDADGLRDAARGSFIRSRAAAENPLSDANLKRLCSTPQHLLIDAVQKLFDEA